MLTLFLDRGANNEVTAMTLEARAALRRDLLRALRRYETPEEVRMHTRTNFFYGRKSGRGKGRP